MKFNRADYKMLNIISWGYLSTQICCIENTLTEAYTVIQSNYFRGAEMGVTSVRLQPEIENPLENLSKKLDRSKNYLINQAIKEFLARQSLEESRWHDTLDALESIKQGKSIDEEDVNAWLNSWGSTERKSPPK